MLLPQVIRAGGPAFRYSVAYFLPWKNALVDELERNGTPVSCLAARSNLAVLLRVPRLARHLRRERVELVHAHLPIAGVAARLAGRLAGVPVVYTEHNVQERYHPATRRLNLATWGLQRHVIAVSSEVADSARRRAGGRTPVSVVRNGIDGSRFEAARAERSATRARLGIPEEAPVVGSVAVFRVQKRLDLWLQAAAVVRASLPNARFLLVGDGPYGPQVTAWAREAGLDDALVRPGLQVDVAPFLGVMDAYLITSEFEGLPLALLEAMAAGLPVVSTPAGGIPEVVRDGATGLLVPPGDARSAAARVVDVLRDPPLRRRLGEAAAEAVGRDFGVARMAGELEALYAAVLAG